MSDQNKLRQLDVRFQAAPLLSARHDRVHVPCDATPQSDRHPRLSILQVGRRCHGNNRVK